MTTEDVELEAIRPEAKQENGGDSDPEKNLPGSMEI